MKKRKKKQYGATTVEFVLVIPFVLILILASLEFTFMTIEKHLLNSAVYSAARQVTAKLQGVSFGDGADEGFLVIKDNNNQSQLIKIIPGDNGEVQYTFPTSFEAADLGARQRRKGLASLNPGDDAYCSPEQMQQLLFPSTPVPECCGQADTSSCQNCPPDCLPVDPPDDLFNCDKTKTPDKCPPFDAPACPPAGCPDLPDVQHPAGTPYNLPGEAEKLLEDQSCSGAVVQPERPYCTPLLTATKPNDCRTSLQINCLQHKTNCLNEMAKFYLLANNLGHKGSKADSPVDLLHTLNKLDNPYNAADQLKGLIDQYLNCNERDQKKQQAYTATHDAYIAAQNAYNRDKDDKKKKKRYIDAKGKWEAARQNGLDRYEELRNIVEALDGLGFPYNRADYGYDQEYEFCDPPREILNNLYSCAIQDWNSAASDSHSWCHEDCQLQRQR